MKKLLLLLSLLFTACSHQKYDVICSTPDGYMLQLDAVVIDGVFGGTISIPLPNGRSVITHISRCMLLPVEAK